jgi:SRSO17 transposase
LPPLPGSGRGQPPKLLRRDGDHHPVSVKTLAHELRPEAWHNIAWREGSADWLASRFACVRRIATLGEPSRAPRSGC